MSRRCVLLLALLSCTTFAQSTLVSPEVHSDRRVTFRLSAPKATEVKLWGEWILKGNTTEKLERDERGIWSVTVGPLNPSIYSYIFLVDEVVVLDPANALLHGGYEGPGGSLVEVRGDTPQVHETQPVPHGVLHTHTYLSSQGLGGRRALVYTPAAYSRNPQQRFPVIYLLHGAGENETSWTNVGRANAILDNLIAAARAKPMIVVMPDNHISAPGSPEPKPAELRNRFAQDLVQDLFPLIDSTYRTLRSRHARAIAGLSMGAYQAMWFAMDHPDLVSVLGIFSGGIFVPAAEGEADIVNFATSPAATKFPLEILRVAIGDHDMNLPLSKKLDALLTQHNVKHDFHITPGAGHEWPFWRQCLAELAPLLFRDRLRPIGPPPAPRFR
jgi:enterochelin esterase-like enzyme